MELGTDFNATGSVMSRAELESQRKKKGECITCGRKCFHKKLFKLVPITEQGRVLNGRCLNCKPLKDKSARPSLTRPGPSREDLAKFNKSQSKLNLSGPGVRTPSARRPQRSSSRSLPTKQSSTRTISSGASVGSNGGERSVFTAPNSSESVATAPAPVASTPRGEDSRLVSPSMVAQLPPPQVSPARSASGQFYEPDGHYHYSREYEEYEHLQRRLSGESLQEARAAIMGEEGAYVLAQSHPGGAALSDYYEYRQALVDQQRGSQRSLHSGASSQTRVDEECHPYNRDRLLDRGGAVLLSAVGSGGSSRSLRSNKQNGYVRESNRSLESMNSFCDGDGSDRIVSPHLGSRGGFEDMSVSQHSSTTRSGQYSAVGSLAHYSSRNLMDSHTSSSILSMTVATRDHKGVDRIHAAGTDFCEIVAIMHDYPESAAVQATGMQQLSDLHFSPEDNETFTHVGAHQVIVDGMKTFPMDVELQISGCRAMWNASGTTSNQLAFVEAGALDIILLSMTQFMGDADVQEQAMATLANLCAVETNVHELVQAGGVMTIVEAMNKHVDNVHVQMKGCSVITNMASHMTPLKRTLMDLGAGGSVIIAMVMHPNDVALQEKALRALRNLSANSDENKVELAESGGIDAVISAMQVHRDAAGVQESGAWTLSNLAGNPENKIKIGDYGGVDVTIRAMWVHSDDVKVQEWCARALFTLSLDPQNSNLIRDVGGISAIVNAMQAHVDAAVVQEMGCAVLYNLALDVPSKNRIVDEEALDAIVLAMVVHSEEVKVQERGCQVLLQLATLENCKAMQASNISELVRTAAERFPAQCEELAHHMLTALDRLAEEYNAANS